MVGGAVTEKVRVFVGADLVLESRQRGQVGTLRLVKKLATLLTTAVPFAELPNLEFSPLPPDRERFLQRGPFIDPTITDNSSYGTQSQTIIIRSISERCVFYFYRRTQGKSAAEASEMPWQVHSVSDPNAEEHKAEVVAE